VVEADPAEKAAEGAGRGGYLHQQVTYAERYETGIRTNKRWVAVGKSASDRCPLDDPEAMLVWWSRRMKQQPPDGLYSALRKEKPDVLGELPLEKSPSAPATDPPPPAPAAPAEEENIDESELTLEAVLDRLHRMEVRLSRKAVDPGQAKPYLDTVSRLTATTTKLREEAERQGALIPRVLAAAAINEFHAPIASGVRGLYRSWCEAIGVPPSPEREEWWHKQVDILFSHFGQEVFR
jgi:hypothetical protein